jgi:hypothetical protein
LVGTYVSAILICAAAVVLGRAVCVVAGHDGSTWLSPAVGLAALMIVCEVAIRLPGHGWTAVVVLVVLCAAALLVGRRAAWPSLTDALPVAAVVLLALSVPFVANARVGVLGISFLNDTHWHLILAEGLRRPAIKPLDDFGPGYPLGPHAISATFAQLLGSDVDRSLTGLMMATPILTGLAALGALADISRLRRWLVAVLAAIPYLASAWYVQSAFKEPILSLLMLGLVLVLQAGRREGFVRPAAVAIPAAVLVAGVVYVYSYPGLLWPAALAVCWVAVELVLGGGWRRLRPIARALRGWLPGIAIGVVLLVILVAPDIGRIHTFWQSNGGTAAGTTGGITTSALANLAAPLHTLEGLNVWLTGDFRFLPKNTLEAGVLTGLALIILVFAIVSALERGDLAWPAAILSFALVYAYAKHSQSPYVAAKALAIPAPLVVLGSGAALMRRLDGPDWRTFGTLAVGIGAVVYLLVAFKSDYLVLRDAQVGPNNHTKELRSLRPLLHGQPTLVLFYDDYFKWELLGVKASSPLLSSPIPAGIQPAKPWSYGQALDWDSINAPTLDKFAYVITTRTTAQSEPPANFHLVGQSRSYEVWKRVGPTQPRRVLAESGQPGATLNCATASGRRVSRENGVARVRPKPLYKPVVALQPGQSEAVTLNLPAGAWDLSLPFLSQQAVTVGGAGLNVRLPPNLDRPGEIWPVGRVRSTGAPIRLTLRMDDPAPITSETQFFTPQPMVAVPVGGERTVPLREACGRYVDWYR